MKISAKAVMVALVVLVLGALAVGLLVRPAPAPSTGDSVAPGLYRLTLTNFPGGGLPLGLEIVTEANGPAAYLVNGGNRVRAERTTVTGRNLTMAFPSYDSSLIAEAQPDGTLTGMARLRRRTGPVELALRAVPGETHRFYDKAAAPSAPIGGEWLLQTKGESGERGVALLRQTGNVLEGTIQFPSGDVRFLAGEMSGADFALSTFDGNQGSLWRGHRLPDGSLAGETFVATSTAPTQFVARPKQAGPADEVVAIAETKPPVDRIAFTFPDATGKPVSLADARFKGKVVVVAIGGTWCPNCHDEATFLSPYAKRRRAEGLEVIGLQFEYGDDPVRAARQQQRFATRYAIDYPLLIAGAATPEGSKKALPAIGGVKIYPTTLFIDRKGKLRTIHTGYAGPATGALNAKTTAEFDALVTKLLAEKA
jgi:peroxiredoxin